MYNVISDIEGVEGFTLITEATEVAHIKEQITPTCAIPG